MVYHKFVIQDMGPPGGWAERLDRRLKDADEAAVARSQEEWDGDLSHSWFKKGLKPYKYVGCCVVLSGDDIDEMVCTSEEVAYSEVLRHCDLVAFSKVFDYSRNSNQGLTLKDDWSVSFHKSTFRGKPCYYLDHSRIEWVWVKR